MHLVNAARSRMTCIPVVHEVAGVIAAEYFNQVSSTGRAYALVTSGPGVTNALTGITGAFLESRNVLVLAGQVKSSDLSQGTVRQRGIQELDGVTLTRSVAKVAAQLSGRETEKEIRNLVVPGLQDREGPVFLEVCLDTQGKPANLLSKEPVKFSPVDEKFLAASSSVADLIHQKLRSASRPVLLIGGGVAYDTSVSCSRALETLGVPLMTTWNGFDRVADNHPRFVGRPNTWGQRHANILLAQSDCIVALGTRLGLQQTGFNWQEWGPQEGEGVVIQVDLDAKELEKGHPRVDFPFVADANEVLKVLSSKVVNVDDEWHHHIALVRDLVPVLDPQNVTDARYISPYHLVDWLAKRMVPADVLVPASSGSGQFVPMETFRSLEGQRVITNKGLASMGYGLAGAIGAALAGRRRVILVEGDGSFSQSIQELGTLAVNHLPVKIFLLDNDGYASIRTTQKSYFGGAYVGCDSATGLGFPNWAVLAESFGIPCQEINPATLDSPELADLLDAPGPAIFVVAVDPDQTYFPKVNSRVGDLGTMISNPIHAMSPRLEPEVARTVFRYRPELGG